MRKWRFRKDLMPNAGGGVGPHHKAKVDYAAISDPYAEIYPSKKIRFGGITQLMCGVFICLFGLGLYTFGIKGWKTEYFSMVSLGSGSVFVVNGIWCSETAKFACRWKIITNVAFCFLSVLMGLSLLISACTAIPVEYRALDEGLIRELTHMQARIVLIIMTVMSDVLCMVMSVSLIRSGFRAILGCCDEEEDVDEEQEQEGDAVRL